MRKSNSRILSIILSFILVFQQTGFAQVAAELNIAVHLSALHNSLAIDKFRPLHLRYLQYLPQENNFKLLLDKGDEFLNEGGWKKDDGRKSENIVPHPSSLIPRNDSKLDKSAAFNPTNSTNLTNAAKDLLKYFFIGLTLPNSSFWVNLRPDAEDNIIDDYLAKTDVGKILLEADLQLKKDTASFTSPQTPEGKEYWDKLYKKAEELYGNENITIPTLTRPWIVPGEIIIRETKDEGGGTAPSAYIYKATLKVMLESDYLNSTNSTIATNPAYQFKDSRSKALNEYSSQLIRELIIPKLTKAVNSSKRYAPLRQVYYSLILAQWFKAKNPSKGDTHNLTNLISQEAWSKTTYFNAYKQSFAQGEYNIQEPVYTPTGQVIRSYFSGGMDLNMTKSASPVTYIAGSRDISKIFGNTISATFANGNITLPDTVASSSISSEPLSFDSVLNQKEASSSISAAIGSFKNGQYLNILETYGVSWSLEKVARDVLQNFFDANGSNLDNIVMSIAQREDGKYVLRITASSEYDFRKLTHIGGTDKNGSLDTVGGFGEGAPVAALTLLRDHGFTEVIHGSKDWRLYFYLSNPPQGSYDVSDIRGLWAKVEPVKASWSSFLTRKGTAGSYIELVSADKTKLDIFLESKKLFYSSENVDFLESTYQGRDFGFKYLGKGKYAFNGGNLYDVGQRRHFDRESWGTVEGLHIWTLKKLFGKDRDRGTIPRKDLEEKVIKPLAAEMNIEDLKKTIRIMEPSWGNGYFYEVHKKLLSAIIDRLEEEGIKLEFDNKYLANDMPFEWGLKERFESEGYVIVDNALAKVGMKKLSEAYLEMARHISLIPTEKQEKLLAILQDSARILAEVPPLVGVTPLKLREIWLFSSKDEKSIIRGQHNTDFVWMAAEKIDEPFFIALSVYLHELSHDYGLDGRREFSDVFTSVIAAMINLAISSHQQLTDHGRQWEKVQEDNSSGSAEESKSASSAVENTSITRRNFLKVLVTGAAGSLFSAGIPNFIRESDAGNFSLSESDSEIIAEQIMPINGKDIRVVFIKSFKESLDPEHKNAAAICYRDRFIIDIRATKKSYLIHIRALRKLLEQIKYEKERAKSGEELEFLSRKERFVDELTKMTPEDYLYEFLRHEAMHVASEKIASNARLDDLQPKIECNVDKNLVKSELAAYLGQIACSPQPGFFLVVFLGFSNDDVNLEPNDPEYINPANIYASRIALREFQEQLSTKGNEIGIMAADIFKKIFKEEVPSLPDMRISDKVLREMNLSASSAVMNEKEFREYWGNTFRGILSDKPLKAIGIEVAWDDFGKGLKNARKWEDLIEIAKDLQVFMGVKLKNLEQLGKLNEEKRQKGVTIVKEEIESLNLKKLTVANILSETAGSIEYIEGKINAQAAETSPGSAEESKSASSAVEVKPASSAITEEVRGLKVKFWYEIDPLRELRSLRVKDLLDLPNIGFTKAETLEELREAVVKFNDMAAGKLKDENNILSDQEKSVIGEILGTTRVFLGNLETNQFTAGSPMTDEEKIERVGFAFRSMNEHSRRVMDIFTELIAANNVIKNIKNEQFARKLGELRSLDALIKYLQYKLLVESQASKNIAVDMAWAERNIKRLSTVLNILLNIRNVCDEESLLLGDKSLMDASRSLGRAVAILDNRIKFAQGYVSEEYAQDVSKIVEEVIKNSDKSSLIKLYKSPGLESARVRGEYYSLMSAVYNVINNAVQRTDKNVDVQVTLDKVGSGGLMVRIGVSNEISTQVSGTGMGIKEATYAARDAGGELNYGFDQEKGRYIVTINLPAVSSSIEPSSGSPVKSNNEGSSAVTIRPLTKADYYTHEIVARSSGDVVGKMQVSFDGIENAIILKDIIIYTKYRGQGYDYGKKAMRIFANESARMYPSSSYPLVMANIHNPQIWEIAKDIYEKDSLQVSTLRPDLGLSQDRWIPYNEGADSLFYKIVNGPTGAQNAIRYGDRMYTYQFKLRGKVKPLGNDNLTVNMRIINEFNRNPLSIIGGHNETINLLAKIDDNPKRDTIRVDGVDPASGKSEYYGILFFKVTEEGNNYAIDDLNIDLRKHKLSGEKFGRDIYRQLGEVLQKVFPDGVKVRQAITEDKTIKAFKEADIRNNLMELFFKTPVGELGMAAGFRDFAFFDSASKPVNNIREMKHTLFDNEEFSKEFPSFRVEAWSSVLGDKSSQEPPNAGLPVEAKGASSSLHNWDLWKDRYNSLIGKEIEDKEGQKYILDIVYPKLGELNAVRINVVRPQIEGQVGSQVVYFLFSHQYDEIKKEWEISLDTAGVLWALEGRHIATEVMRQWIDALGNLLSNGIRIALKIVEDDTVEALDQGRDFWTTRPGRIFNKFGFRLIETSVKKIKDGKYYNVVVAKTGEGLAAEKTNAIASSKSVSSAVEDDVKGGIDMRALPIVTQAMSVPGDSFLSASSLSNLRKLSSAAIEGEWQEINNMVNAGIIPSTDRIKEYLKSCCASSAINQEADKVLSCLADILRIEEERVQNTESGIKEMLSLLESDKPADQMQLALAKITVEAREPAVIGQ